MIPPDVDLDHLGEFIDETGLDLYKMFVDGGASVNLMPYTTFRKLVTGFKQTVVCHRPCISV